MDTPSSGSPRQYGCWQANSQTLVPGEPGWVARRCPGSLTDVKSLVGAFLAIVAINGAPGVPAGLATYLTVGVAVIAVVVHLARRRRHATELAVPAQVSAAVGPAPTIVAHIYTTSPVVLGGAAPAEAVRPPVWVHSERVGRL